MPRKIPSSMIKPLTTSRLFWGRYVRCGRRHHSQQTPAHRAVPQLRPLVIFRADGERAPGLSPLHCIVNVADVR